MKSNTQPIAFDQPRLVAGRYSLLGRLNTNGSGDVYLGKLVAAAGFERSVILKMVDRNVVADQQLVSMFRDEVRLLARVRHTNVPAALDVVEDGDKLWLVMEHIHGESLPLLMQSGSSREGIPVRIAAAICVNVLNGLHAAHDATDVDQRPMNIVHRDVSPQNVLVGYDGLARIIDFSIASSTNRLQRTEVGQIKGKLGYTAPECFEGVTLDRRADVYGAAIVLWETLTGRPLFEAETQAQTIERVLSVQVEPPRHFESAIPPALDAIVLKALQRNPDDRYQSARDMAQALTNECEVATSGEVAEWVSRLMQSCGAKGENVLPTNAVAPTRTSSVVMGSRAPQHKLPPAYSSDVTMVGMLRPLTFNDHEWRPQPVAAPGTIRAPEAHEEPRAAESLKVKRSVKAASPAVLVRRGAMVLAACALMGLVAASRLGKAAGQITDASSGAVAMADSPASPNENSTAAEPLRNLQAPAQPAASAGLEYPKPSDRKASLLRSDAAAKAGSNVAPAVAPTKARATSPSRGLKQSSTRQRPDGF